MAELNSLIKEKENLLNNIIDETKREVEQKLKNKNKKINFLKLKNLRKMFYLFIKEKTNLKLNRNIVKNIKQIANDYSKFNVKLEDLDGIKLIISQVEAKEKKIILLEKENENIKQENSRFNEIFEKNQQTILELNNFNTKLNNDINNLKKIIIDKEEELNKQINNNKNLDKTIFELEGIKKIQYETIYNLKNKIKKYDDELMNVKNQAKGLVDEFNKILEILE